jgi:hypothetical protein
VLHTSEQRLPPYDLREPAVLAFVLIPLVLVFLFIWGVGFAWRRAASESSMRFAIVATACAAGIWLPLTLGLAASGVFAQWDRVPPPFMGLVASVVVIASSIAFSRVGERLARFVPLFVLVGVQSFRLPLEIAMHHMAERGITPAQMSYGGRNFDILTGLTAIPVALWLWSGRGRWLAALWNVVGLALLLNVVIVALVSTPRFQWFGPDRVNVWVAYPPFVWLPAVMVLAALAGHLVVFRALVPWGRPSG